MRDWGWWAAAKQQLPDDVHIERSIDGPVVVDQRDECFSNGYQLGLDGSQAG